MKRKFLFSRKLQTGLFLVLVVCSVAANWGMAQNQPIEYGAMQNHVQDTRRQIVASWQQLSGIPHWPQRADLIAQARTLGALAYNAKLLEIARDCWAACLQYDEKKLPEEHPDLQDTRVNLALALSELGDLSGAGALEEKVLAARTRTLPDHHPDLQTIRASLAVTRFQLGNYAGARQLQEKVLAVRSQTLPDDDPRLQAARNNLFITLYQLEDWEAARGVLQKILEAQQRTLPDDHPDLQATREDLALTLAETGDLIGARNLFEKALEVYAGKLGDEHEQTQNARRVLANIYTALGDLRSARKLQETVLEVFARNLPDGHPELQAARSNLAVTLFGLDSLKEARALEEKNLSIYDAKSLPEDDPARLSAQTNLAGTLFAMGEYEKARHIQEKVLAIRAKTLPAAHPNLLTARANLALTLYKLGNLAAARQLQEEVVEVKSKALAEDDQSLHAALRNLSWTLVWSQDSAAALPILQRWLKGLRELRLQARFALAPRELEALAADHADDLAVLLSLGLGAGFLAGEFPLRSELFEATEGLRGLGLHQARFNRLLEAAKSDSSLVALRHEITQAVQDIDRLAQSSFEDDGKSLAEAVRRRDRAQRALFAYLEQQKGAEFLPASSAAEKIAAALQPDEVAIGYWTYSKLWKKTDGKLGTAASESMLAWVLQSNGTLERVELGAMEPIRAAIGEWRRAVTGRADVQTTRNLRVKGAASSETKIKKTGEQLRQLVLDPILQRLPSRTQRLIIASDDALHLVPLEALPWQKSLVGDYYQIRMTPTLSELSVKEKLALAEPSLVLAGGIDYDTPAEKYDPALAPNLVAAAIPVDPSQDLVSGKFAYLHGTRQEILAIRELFENTFGKQALVLQDSQATKERLTQLASRARYLHVATHGYYAPEVAASAARQNPSPVSEVTMSGLPETVRGLSPSLLCGLALSGAILPADAIGRTAGIITAEELSLLDLASCELAVLSACETNVGLVQGGQGMASLQKALHAGGARLTITSLWSVPDDATKELMEEFYRQVWAEHQPIAEALWRAKKMLREKKDARGKPAHPLLDWAGFVLVGVAH